MSTRKMGRVAAGLFWSLYCRLDIERGLRVARWFGRIPAWLLHARLRRDLDELFHASRPPSAPEARRIIRDFCAHECMDITLRAYRKTRGDDVASRRIDTRTLMPLQELHCTNTPAILLTWHVGTPGAFRLLHVAAGVPVLFMVHRHWRASEGAIEVAEIGDDAVSRAESLWRALQRLRHGGLVMMAADGRHGATLGPIGGCGRAIRPARGAFTLARITGAPVVPAVWRWTAENRIALHLGAPITAVRRADTGDVEFETGLASRAVAWLETYVAATPGDLKPAMVKRILEWPRCA